LWSDHEIAALHETHKTIEHPQVGLLRLDCDVLRVDGADLRVVLFTAAPGTPQADALILLASLQVTPVL
jgi:MmyB-like transcription regulator ligand binding domain